jgi:uncharacterized protein YndB with AHSA1/START domain
MNRKDTLMTTATDRAETSEDFERTLTFAASSGDVLASLRTPEAISSWWCPATGSTERGSTLEMASRSGSKFLELRVEPGEEGRVVWSVLRAPLTPEWVGTTIVFDVEEAGAGATLHFRHHGLTTKCDCFDMCQEGWTNALDRLISFAETGVVAYPRDSFHSTMSIAAPPEAVLAALSTTEAVTSWWGPATGSADVGSTLVVSFMGGRQRIVMDVERAFENRVAWAVKECPLTPDWIGTTIFFDVAEDGDGAMLYFRHQGLTPELDCFDMCHEGWTHFLASLASYAETGVGQPHTED